MKTKLIYALASALLLASASSLAAQSDDLIDDKKSFKAYFSLGQNLAHGHGHDLTQCTWGGIGQYHAEAGIQFYHELSTLLVRPNVAYTRILGNPKEGMDVYDAAAYTVGFDLVYNISKRFPLTATMGPSFHFWNVDLVNFSMDSGTGSSSQGDSSAKFGWRLGLGYEINSKYRVDFTYTLTEWRSSRGNDYVPGFNPSLPAYFTVKASYTF